MNLSIVYGYFIVGLLWILFGLVEGLKDLVVSLPPVIRRGETAVFMCDFDLEGDSLYSVKWYKEKREFFRYTPKDEFPIKIFSTDGLLIDKSKSNMTRLTVENVQPSMSGRYSCEVSAEQSFHTVLKSAVMDVVDVPVADPVLEGVKRRYKIGDMLDVNCTSGKSNPPVNLTWFVNEESANRNQVFKIEEGSSPANGSLFSSKSNIRFVVTSHDFPGGYLRLRCSATIHNIYHRSTDVIIEEDNPFILDSTQVVVASANFQDATHESNHRKRFYSDDSGSVPSPKLMHLALIQLICIMR